MTKVISIFDNMIVGRTPVIILCCDIFWYRLPVFCFLIRNAIDKKDLCLNINRAL